MQRNNISLEAGSNKAITYLIFILSPLLSLILALRNIRSTWSMNILWMFVTFYGYTLVISNELMDANAYRDKFIEMTRSEITLDNFGTMLYDEETQVVDVVQPLITMIVSRFTDNYHVLFAVFGLIFGFFYSRNIGYLLKIAEFKLSKKNIIILFTFAIVVGFWKINGFRFWTATQIFFYGAIPYIFERKKSRLWVCLLTGFVHFSYFLPMILLLGYALIGNRSRLLFGVFILTFFVSELDLTAINNMLTTYLPDFLHDKVDAYTNEDYAQAAVASQASHSLHARIYDKSLKVSLFVFVLMIYYKSRQYLDTDKRFKSLFCCALFFTSVTNILKSIPSVGRFESLSQLFMIAAVFVYVHYAVKPKVFYNLYPALTAAMVLFCVVAFRIGLDTIGLATVAGNPVSMFFAEGDLALIQLLK